MTATTKPETPVRSISECEFNTAPHIRRPEQIAWFSVKKFKDDVNGTAKLVNGKFIVINDETYVPMENVCWFTLKPQD